MSLQVKNLSCIALFTIFLLCSLGLTPPISASNAYTTQVLPAIVNSRTVRSTIDTDYLPIWQSESGYLTPSGFGLKVGQENDSGYYQLWRMFLTFNTSSIVRAGYYADVKSAKLQLNMTDDYSDVDFNVTIQSGQPEFHHYPLASSDYGKRYYSGNGGTISTSGWSSGAKNITLNNAGKTMIFFGFLTKLCLRSSKDIEGIAPSGNQSVLFNRAWYNDPNSPTLFITYEWKPVQEKTLEPWSVPSEDAGGSDIVGPTKVDPLPKIGLYAIVGIMGLLAVGGAYHALTKKKSSKPTGRTKYKPRSPKGRFKRD